MLCTLAVTGLAGGPPLTTLLRPGLLLRDPRLLHQLCGRLEQAGAFGETSSHPLGLELRGGKRLLTTSPFSTRLAGPGVAAGAGEGKAGQAEAWGSGW